MIANACESDVVTMRLLSLNIKGGADLDKVSDVINFLTNQRVDIALLCESHITNERSARYKQRWPNFGWFTNCPETNQCGVTFVILNSSLLSTGSCSLFSNDGKGRMLGLRLKAEGKFIRILGLYAPNSESDSVTFFNQMNPAGKERIHVMMGDFNRCESRLDRNPPRGEDLRVRESIAKATQNGNLVDGWREINPDERQFTYWSDNELRSASRLDRIYVTRKVFRKSAQWTIIQTPGWTDHAAVSVDYWPRERVEMGKGQWYMNTNLLPHTEMRSALTSVLEEGLDFIAKTTVDRNLLRVSTIEANAIVSSFIEVFNRIQTTAQEVQNTISRRSKKLALKLENRIKRIDTQLRTKKNAKRLKSFQKRLETLQAVRNERRLLFAKAKQLEMGSQADLFSMKNLGTPDRSIRALTNKRGKVKKKPGKKLNIARDYFEELYTVRETSEEAQERLLQNITPGDFSGTTGEVSIEEVMAVLKHWDRGSVPGPGGVPYDFFKDFKDVGPRGCTLVEVLRMVMTILIQPKKYHVMIPTIWTKGVVKLLWKKKGEITDIKNYRPLSMTESIYKLFTSIINNRLIKPFSRCIGKHQAGFLPGRSYFDHVKEIQGLLDLAKERQDRLYVVLLDQEKAYDRVDHVFLWKVLLRFGVPEELTRAIQGCYAGAKSIVSVNKFISEPFDVQTGVRQGDPLSCLLFNAAIETLALSIQKDCRLPGFIDETGLCHKENMYADDTCVIITELRQYRTLLRIYDTYARASGSALNQSKTKILCALGTANEPDSYLGAEVVGTETYLGIPIGPDADYHIFWKKMHDKVRASMGCWGEPRFLSKRQRVAIANTCLESLIWYHLRQVPSTMRDLEPIERTVLRFVWNRPEGTNVVGDIPLRDTYRPITEGGLGLIKISTMRKTLGLYWIQRLEEAQSLESEDRPPWYPVLMEIMTRRANPEIRPMLTKPWKQVWESRPPPLPSSIDQFLRLWKLDIASIPPTNREELANTDFWFHPRINRGRTRVRWAAPIWHEFFEGTTNLTPVKTLGQMWVISSGEVYATQRQKGAAMRFMANLPEEWQEIGVGSSTSMTTRESIGFYSFSSQSHIPIRGTSNNQHYAHIAPDGYSQKDLLANFRALCARDRVDLRSISDKKIWLSLRQRGVDYPKFTDLYWQLIMGTVRTGEEWMTSANCPICNTLQVAEHLFWICPAARQVWAKLREIWQDITNEDVDFPTTWAALLLSGVTHSKKSFGTRFDKRRWRILFSEGLWSIWLHRCAWSFDELQTFEEQAIVPRYDAKITLRRMVDRQLALDSHASDVRLTFEETWKERLSTSEEENT